MAVLTAYLSFDGNAREALEFYRDVFGGELVVNTFAEFMPPDTPGADGIMHGQLETPAGFTIMAADVPPVDGAEFRPAGGMSIVVFGDEVEELRGYWSKLADGATIGTELAPQMWGDEYGDLVDRFGTPWGFNISGATPAAQ